MSVETTFDGASFFEVILPALLGGRWPAVRAAGGVVQFRLITGETYRSWFVDAASAAAEVIEGEHRSADVAITIDEPLVGPMLLGELDVDAALASGDVAIEGRAEVFTRWVELFTQDRSTIGVRVRGDTR